MTEKHCPGCRTTREFIAPPCEDGHDDCVDLACVECGFAVTGMTILLVPDAVLAA